MRRAPSEAEAWKRMVLRSMPPPAWLSSDAPHSDVVLSSRVRVMRNLKGHRFVHRADTPELEAIFRKVQSAVKSSVLGLDVFKQISNAERDYLVGCRLASPDFEWSGPGRALLLDGARSLSVMINEEDHLRIQALTAGWSIENSYGLAQHCLAKLEQGLEFAHSPTFGYLSASPYNVGPGRRLSAMFHLIGLANGKRLPAVLKALAARGLAARGLFGESSRAIGAFVQVSAISGNRSEFVGACEYLMVEEREARSLVGIQILAERAEQARSFALTLRTISLADALRVLAWVRWAAYAEVPGFPYKQRETDIVLTMLELRGGQDRTDAARAESLRTSLEV